MLAKGSDRFIETHKGVCKSVQKISEFVETLEDAVALSKIIVHVH